MSIDHQSRLDLQRTLVGYMAGRIRTFAFDDRNSDCLRSSDKSLEQISQFLFSLHDDFIDHPISVAPIHWASLLRVVAFLGTDLEIGTTAAESSWPFQDDEQWHGNENLINEFDLPDYDISVHHRIVNRWWNKIPSTVGLLVLSCIVAGVVATLLIL